MNRNKHQFVAETVELHAVCTLSSGTPTLVTGAGITAVAKAATGTYTLTLSRQYYHLLEHNVFIQTANGLTNETNVGVHTADTDLGSKTVKLVVNDDGTAADLPDGTSVFKLVVCQQSKLFK